MRSLFIIMALVSAPVFLHTVEIGDVRSMYLKGVTALSENQLKEAEFAFSTLIEIPEETPLNLEQYRARSHYYLGDIAFIRQDYITAVREYRTVTEKYPYQDVYSKAMYKLGRTLVLNDRPQEGSVILTEYAAKYANKDGLADNALYWSARAKLQLEKYEESYLEFQRLLKNYPDSSLSYEVRQNMDQLETIIARQRQGKTGSRLTVLELEEQKQKSVLEKGLLERMSRMLALKQALLEVKSIKVEQINRLSGQEGVLP